jgi:hypothetical protein
MQHVASPTLVMLIENIDLKVDVQIELVELYQNWSLI